MPLWRSQLSIVKRNLTNDVIEELRASNGWADCFRDCRSELVFIVIRVYKKLMLKELHNALLTNAEFGVPDQKNARASELTDISSMGCHCGNWRTYWRKKTAKMSAAQRKVRSREQR